MHIILLVATSIAIYILAVGSEGGVERAVPPFEPCLVYDAAYVSSGPRPPLEERTTLVTSYFALSSAKHSHSEYDEWMETMVCIDAPLVAYVDAGSEAKIRELRTACLDGSDLDVRITTFEEFHTSKWRDVLVQQAGADPEAAIGHSVKLYMIWDEKSAWLDQVATDNPFGTKYFAWVDIGYFRGHKYKTPSAAFTNIPWPAGERVRQLDDNRVMLLGLAPVVPGSAECSDIDSVFDAFSTRGIGGGFIAGTAQAVHAWADAFYAMTQDFVDSGRFIGKDQIMMAAVACSRADLVRVVPTCGGDWFYIANYLRPSLFPAPV